MITDYLLKMTEIPLSNKYVMMREDFNVPMENGKITNTARIERALASINLAIKNNARLILLSHLGRPKEGQFDAQASLAPVAECLSQLLKRPVRLVRDWLDGVEVAPGEVVLAENVRFNVGEENNDVQLSKRMAKHCDVFVMDAFATAHRAQASTVGIAQYAPIACAGPLLIEELNALSKALEHPKQPLVAIVGGSKVSTKIQVLNALLKKVDQLIVGGGIANNFLRAQGYEVGISMVEEAWVNEAKKIMDTALKNNVSIPLPVDVCVAKEFSKNAKATVRSIKEIKKDEMILDIGPETEALYTQLLNKAETIVWNGPVGVFEFPEFCKGTKAIATAIANSPAFSLAGGGDTLAALDQFHCAEKISYVSTGGGAFLEFVEGKVLPAVEILIKKAKKS